MYTHSYALYTGHYDAIQAVRCTLTGSNTHFQLRFTHNPYILSAPIYTTDIATAIQSKIESMHGVGNVTVVFPRVLTDGILTACNSNTNITTGGFWIMFNYSLGTYYSLCRCIVCDCDVELVYHLYVNEYVNNTGNIPLMEVVNSTQTSHVVVDLQQSGLKLNKECSGESGYCNRQTGLCMCDELSNAVSSDGSFRVGPRGDCGTRMAGDGVSV